MFENPKKARDAFTFSLGGMNTISSFVAAPAVADDRINRIRDQRMSQRRSDADRKPRAWFRRFRPAHQGSGA